MIRYQEILQESLKILRNTYHPFFLLNLHLITASALLYKPNFSKSISYRKIGLTVVASQLSRDKAWLGTEIKNVNLGDGPTPKPNFFIEYSVVNTEPNNGKNSIVCGMVHGTWGCKRCLVASPVITTRAHNNPVLFVIPTVQISNFKINLKGEKVYQQFHLQQLRTLSTLLTSSILPFVWSEKTLLHQNNSYRRREPNESNIQ